MKRLTRAEWNRTHNIRTINIGGPENFAKLIDFPYVLERFAGVETSITYKCGGGSLTAKTAGVCSTDRGILMEQLPIRWPDSLPWLRQHLHTTDTTITLAHIVWLCMFNAHRAGEIILLPDGTSVRRLPSVANGNVERWESENYTYLSQNPYKQGSKWAALAREGKLIMWVIRRSDNAWIGRVVDGNLTRL